MNKPGNKKRKDRHAVAKRKSAIEKPSRDGSLKEPHSSMKSNGSTHITEPRKDGKIIIDSVQPVPVKRRRIGNNKNHKAASQCLPKEPESRPKDLYITIKLAHRDSLDVNVVQTTNDSVECGTSRASDRRCGLNQETGEDDRMSGVVVQNQAATVPEANKLCVPAAQVPKSSTAFEAQSKRVVKADVSCRIDDGRSNSLNGKLISSLNQRNFLNLFPISCC